VRLAPGGALGRAGCEASSWLGAAVRLGLGGLGLPPRRGGPCAGPRVVTWLAHGCPPQAIVAAFGFAECTVMRWMARGGGQGQAVQTHLVEQPRHGADAWEAGRRYGHRTTAMAAGITDQCWRVHELLAYHVPPPRWTPPTQRGRPSYALKRLIERWCGNHC
jgi:hypothetical protein